MMAILYLKQMLETTAHQTLANTKAKALFSPSRVCSKFHEAVYSISKICTARKLQNEKKKILSLSLDT